MKKGTLFALATALVFTFAMTVTVLTAEYLEPNPWGGGYPECCTYHFDYEGHDCWMGGNYVGNSCVPAEPFVIITHPNGTQEIVDNPCYYEPECEDIVWQ